MPTGIRCSQLTYLQLARYTVHVHAKCVEGALHKAERATPQHTLEKLTIAEKGKRRFKEQKPLLTAVPAKTRDAVLAALEQYKSARATT